MKFLYADRIATPLGRFFAVVDERGALVALDFDDQGPAARMAGLVLDEGRLQHVAGALERYFAGRLTEFELAVAPAGTPFQQRVWSELQRIPYGTTISYSELARRLGDPRAVRAVGRANGMNPVAIVIPCHRVIGADGTLTGYAGGLERKRALLELEARTVGRPQQLALA